MEKLTHPQTLTQVQSSKVYVNSYVDIFILNVNESPSCPRMVELRSYYVQENSIIGTGLSNNLGKYEAAMLDNTAGESPYITYRMSDPNDITGRLFMENINANGCNLGQDRLLQNGVYKHIFQRNMSAKMRLAKTMQKLGI